MYDINIKNLNVVYGKKNVLKNINLSIKPKEFLGIIGPNGGGKTTLVKTLLGLIKYNSGSISIKSKAKLGYVPQKTCFEDHFPITVLEVVLMGSLEAKLKISHNYTEQIVNKSHTIMKELSILNLKHKQISELSGGEQQKVLIARALMGDPDILILDEPTANIDYPTEKEIYNLLFQLNKEMTIILISHNLDMLIQYATSFACINRVLYFHGPKKDINNSIIFHTYGFSAKGLIDKNLCNHIRECQK